ncbi:MAG TPA: T9SS type A sorting domain-containing protein [Saprospiraceae bacterium]|nr:T9SS type A sorting domain-containing protein [Saprospiraceae bacterium]HMQ84058.1 T9SS type A sorting domain-containing protein [Saprospiraceae bacterium]
MKKMLTLLALCCCHVVAFGYANTSETLPFSKALPNQMRWYVDADATGLQNGLAWTDAFIRLQDALAAAQWGDTIWVAQGVYTPAENDNRNLSFYLKSGVALYGGFNGTETNLQERNWHHQQTILSGNIGNPADSTDNSYNVVTALGVDSTARLDGFVITAGYALYPSQQTDYRNYGGGLVVLGTTFHPNSHPSIENCRFEKNIGFYGGGLACKGIQSQRPSANIRHCIFENNKGTFRGGGLYIETLEVAGNTLNMEADTFRSNWAFAGGGGVYLYNVGGLTMQYCLIEGNSSISGAGVEYVSYFCIEQVRLEACVYKANRDLDMNSPSSFEFIRYANSLFNDCQLDFDIQKCRFEGHENPEIRASGINITTYRDDLILNIESTDFIGNRGTNPSNALEIKTVYSGQALATISNCTFRNNRESASLYVTGATGIEDSLILHVYNSIFYGNDGAAYIRSNQDGYIESHFQNCSFFENGSLPIFKSSAFLNTSNYNFMYFDNCLFWETEAGVSGISDIFFSNDVNIDSLSPQFRLNHCIISADDCESADHKIACGESNWFQLYPEFLDTLAGDLRLSACSPALNIGNNELWVDQVSPLDLAGNDRILDGQVDLGAYERVAFSASLDTSFAASCFGSADAQVLFTANGDLPYTYNWIASNGDSGQGQANLPANDYFFQVVDAHDCVDSVFVVLSEPDSIMVQSVINPTSVSEGGSIELTHLSGGTPPYQLLWSNGEENLLILDHLPAGTYTLSITDANGCMQQLDFEVAMINQNQALLPHPALWVVFPNPVKAGHTIQIQTAVANPREYDLVLTDMLGRLVGIYPLENNNKLILHQPGIYHLSLQDKATTIVGSTRLLVVE